MSEQPNDADEIAAFVKAIVAHLERPGCPPNPGCSHLGLHYSFNDESVGISTQGAYLQVMIYRSNWPNPIVSRSECSCCHRVEVERSDTDRGYPATVHNGRVTAIAKALDTTVRTCWNGQDGNDGISVIYNRFAPDSLRTAEAAGANARGGRAFYEWATGPGAPEGPAPTPKVEVETKIIKIVIDAKTGKPTDKPAPTFRDLLSWARMAEVVRRSGVLQPRLSHLIVGEDGVEFCYPDDEEAKR